MFLNCGVGEGSWESLGDSTSPREIQPVNPKEISPEYSLKGLMLKLKLQYFGHLMQRSDSLEKTWCWERLKVGGEGSNRGWDGWMASPTRWTWVWVGPGVGDGQGSLACYSPWGCKESDTTERVNWTDEGQDQYWSKKMQFVCESRVNSTYVQDSIYEEK